ncbi:hypothetical protein CRUP_028079, partial [Coryphaenoides rupestris]
MRLPPASPWSCADVGDDSRVLTRIEMVSPAASPLLPSTPVRPQTHTRPLMHHIRRHFRPEHRQHFPNDDDQVGAAKALMRLQDTYKLDTQVIASGDLP